jgi:hypothetical protein
MANQKEPEKKQDPFNNSKGDETLGEQGML